VLDDGGACKEKAVQVVGLVVRYSLSHPVWSGTLVGNTHLLCDIRRPDVGDAQGPRGSGMRAERCCVRHPPLALIFDMDGVLVDSEPQHKRAKEMAFQKFGIVLPESVYDSYKGRPDATVLGEILEERGLSHRLPEALRLKHQFFESIEHGVRAVPGAVEFVLWAKSRYRMALATSATPRNRTKALSLLGIADYFEVVIDADGFQHPKPDPEIFLTAMKGLHLSATECWVIEDSVNGLRAAKAAGCAAVAITTTFDANVLSAAGADVVVDSFAELRRLLESL